MDAKSLEDIQRVLDAISVQYKVITSRVPLRNANRYLASSRSRRYRECSGAGFCVQHLTSHRSPDRKGELRELEAHLAALDRVVKKIVHGVRAYSVHS